MTENNKETKIIIAGFGGQGVVAAGNVIARACVKEGKNVTGMVSYGVEMRGGTANATVVISDGEISSPIVDMADVAIVMNRPSLDKFEDKVVKGGVIVVNTSLIDREVVRDDITVVKVDATNTADWLGNSKVANIVAVGAFAKKTKLLKTKNIAKAIEDLFATKKSALIAINKKALKAGCKAGKK
jgi:2-oxoglutarate ferredoxin oxidoreductase subunit gamma